MSSLTRHYETFLISNVSTISTLESSLRSVTWFLPGRFKDAELASEALTTMLNVMSMYHDTLLARIIRSTPKYKPLIPSSLHTRYTRAWSDKDNRYKWAARILELLRFTELVIEMCLQRTVSAKNRWRGVLFLEVVKTLLRLLLVRVTRRPLLAPPIPERDFDPGVLSLPSNTSSPTLAPSSPPYSPPATPEHLKNNHIPVDPHPLLAPSTSSQSDMSVEDYLLPKALTTSSVKLSTMLVKALVTPQDWLAEMIYIFRPLVYVSLLTSDRHSNRPLMVALGLELISRNIRRLPPTSAALERSEYARRDRDILWYLLRGSIWVSYTRPKIEAFAKSASHTPLLGFISAFVKDWMPLIDEYYYYTAP